MGKYILKRLAIGILTLFILATITFFLMHAIPGSPFGADNKNLTPEQYAAMQAKYNLDKPLFQQYTTYMVNLLHMDFVESISKKGELVLDIILKRAPVTARLGACAFVISVVAGITLGIVGALTKKKWVNGFITFLATLGVSLPSFIVAILLMIFLGVKLKIFPLLGLSTPASYVLPTIALSIGPIAMVTRLTRSSLKDVMNKDYIILARSKGTDDVKVIIKHALRNALLPVITYCGPLLAGLVTGSFVVETLFTIPGIGKEFTSSVTNRDYPMIMGLTVFLGAIVILMQLASDIVAAIVDPRIKVKS